MSSDAILRDRIVGSLFKGLGAMPIKNGLRDSVIIREMVKVIKSNGSLALYPEGTRTWNGVTHTMDPSIAKLVKLLGVPVITARMKGAYLMDPRWCVPLRRAAMEIDFEKIITKEEIKKLSEAEIFSRIVAGLQHDDTAYQRKKKILIQSEKRAEQVEKIVFQCQECQEFTSFSSKGNGFTCESCRQDYELDPYGFVISSSELKFDNLRDWVDWQNGNFVNYLINKYNNNAQEPLFIGKNLSIERAVGDKSMQKLGVGDVSFYRDRMDVMIGNDIITLQITDISSIGAQYMERVEFFYDDFAYRFVGRKHGESGLKWELATNVIWALNGQNYKVANYFKEQLSEIFHP